MKTPDGDRDWVNLHVTPGGTDRAAYRLGEAGTDPVLYTIPGHRRRSHGGRARGPCGRRRAASLIARAAHRFPGVGWILIVLLTAGAAAPRAVASTVMSSVRPNQPPASHEVNEAAESLREAHRSLQGAIRAGDLEAIHESEAGIDEALHGLENCMPSLPEIDSVRARSLLDQGFEIVDLLHEAAEKADVPATARLARNLSPMIDDIEAVFLASSTLGEEARHTDVLGPWWWG